MNRETMKDYEEQMRLEEKCQSTISKYLQIAREFTQYMTDQELTKELLLEYKEYLCGKHAPAGVNIKLAAVNSFLRFLGREECRVKYLKIQRQMFAKEEKELNRDEYQRLLKAAEGKQIYYIIQVIAASGIRVSELVHITVEALRKGEAVVYCKNKIRRIFIPKDVCEVLKTYAKENGIKTGSIFLNKKGRPVDRTKVWKEMKKLCAEADVDPEKVFPHNLRHLFARTFYSSEKDIVRLADLLGHSSLQTTRIYTSESGAEHKKGLERVQKLLNSI